LFAKDRYVRFLQATRAIGTDPPLNRFEDKSKDLKVVHVKFAAAAESDDDDASPPSVRRFPDTFSNSRAGRLRSSTGKPPLSRLSPSSRTLNEVKLVIKDDGIVPQNPAPVAIMDCWLRFVSNREARYELKSEHNVLVVGTAGEENSANR
jgi:hypothetical protein